MKRKILLIIFLTIIFVSYRKSEENIDATDRYSAWRNYRGTKDANQFSSLQQIDTTNVHLLHTAWVYHTGDAGERTTIECNPIIIDEMMYVTSPTLQLIALHAATGKELWKFNPDSDHESPGVNRGVTYWKQGDDKRILYGFGNYLYAVDAQQGKLVKEFGANGKIDLRENLGSDPSALSISMTTPGIIFNDMIIIGSATGEGYNSSPGHIRAYDVRSGKLIWIFHTIPREGSFGYQTWNWVEGENYGGANNWSGLSLDEQRGVVYAATGSPTYDFYGANRIGENLFGNCVIALDATTGERKWHYQAVHHDLWDYDLACAPNLITIPYKNNMVDVVVQPTKMGTLIVLDRDTGQPLTVNQETPVPASDVPGEQAYPTQPLQSDLVIVKQGLDEENLTDISPESHAYALQAFKKYRHEGMFTPPSLKGTIAMPGTRGGFLWGGASYDPNHHMLYVNANELALILKISKVENQLATLDMQHEGEIADNINEAGQSLYLLNCSNCHGTERQGVPNAFPALRSLKKKYNREQVENIITQGKGMMPPHTQFNEQQLANLVDFLFETNTASPEAIEQQVEQAPDRYVLDGFNLFLDQDGYPATKPPWGTLNAIDMSSFELVWKVPLGGYPDLLAKGIPPTGTQNFGGCVATAGGLVFIGGAADEKFRAFDAKTGKVLWETKLPAGGYATPAVYEVNDKQYVVIAAGGGNRNGTLSGDAYVAFSLPD